MNRKLKCLLQLFIYSFAFSLSRWIRFLCCLLLGRLCYIFLSFIAHSLFGQFCSLFYELFAVRSKMFHLHTDRHTQTHTFANFHIFCGHLFSHFSRHEYSIFASFAYIIATSVATITITTIHKFLSETMLNVLWLIYFSHCGTELFLFFRCTFPNTQIGFFSFLAIVLSVRSTLLSFRLEKMSWK